MDRNGYRQVDTQPTLTNSIFLLHIVCLQTLFFSHKHPTNMFLRCWFWSMQFYFFGWQFFPGFLHISSLVNVTMDCPSFSFHVLLVRVFHRFSAILGQLHIIWLCLTLYTGALKHLRKLSYGTHRFRDHWLSRPLSAMPPSGGREASSHRRRTESEQRGRLRMLGGDQRIDGDLLSPIKLYNQLYTYTYISVSFKINHTYDVKMFR